MKPRASSVARFAAVALLALTVIACRKLVHQAAEGSGDAFTYHFAARAVVEGANPYRDPLYLYPPFWAWALSPFGGLPATVFAVAWGAVQGLLWVAAVAGIRRLQGRGDAPLSWTLDVLPSALLFRCVFNGWGHGQVALLLLALLTWAFVCDARGRAAAAGLLVAVAGAIKIFPLFAAVAFVRRGSRALAWTALFSLVVWAAPAVSLGMTRCVELVAVDLKVATTASAWDRPFSKDNNAPAPMLAARAGVREPRAMKRAVTAWAVACGVACLAVLRPGAAGAAGPALVMATMVVIVPVLWTSYFTFLLLPLSALIAAAQRGEPGARAAAAVAVGIAGLVNLSTSALGWDDTDGASGRWMMMAAAALLAWAGALAIASDRCPELSRDARPS